MTLQQQIRVLHVDDNPSITDLTGTFLEREDDRFAVETATSADDGLETIEDRPPDCVISDYNMPGMDGLEFLQAVREEYPDLPFILFTGKGSETVASDAIAADVTDYLQKGSGSEQYELLANRIRNAVQARRDAARATRQEQLMRLTEFAGDTGGFELDRESGIILLTAGTRRIIGRPDQPELSLQEAVELFHPDDREDIQQTLDEVFQTGEELQRTWRLQPADGDERLLDLTITPVVENGEVTKLRGAGHDITDQHERQQELKTERRFTTQALSALDDLFYVIDADGTLRRWNEKTLDITGYSESELDGMPVIELFPEDERETAATSIERALTDGEARVNADLLTADGQRVPYEFTGARLTDENGTTTGLVGVGRDLTERRRERRLRALVEESNDVISILDADGVFRYQSPSAEHILGYDPEEMVGDTAWEYVHPDDRADLIETIEHGVADAEANPTAEYRIRHADGSWRWMEARGNNQLDNPAVEGYVVNSQDITERKERERDLAQTHDLMLNMEALADVGAWEYDPETDRLMLTDGTRRIHGLDPGAELPLEAAFDTVHPDDRDLLEDRFDACLETGEPYETDVRLTTPDGEQRWITTRGERVTDDASGDVVRGYIQDITDSKEREQQLSRERHRYTTLFETLPNPVLHARVEDGEPVVEIVNPAFEDTFGYDAETIRDEPLHDFILPDGRADAGHQLKQRVLTEGEVRTEVQLETTDGVRTFRLNVSTRHAETEDHEGYAVYTDITEQKQMERALEPERNLVTGIVETVPTGFSAVDADGSVSLVNEQISSGWLMRMINMTKSQ